MNRTIEYTIPESQNGLRVEQFLRRKGYSRQNFTEIKRMPQSILVNGIHYYMRQTLAAGDHLQVCICETESSEKIPPVKLPLNIVYEDEDILVINKPAGMPIHPSMKNYYNSLANAWHGTTRIRGKPFYLPLQQPPGPGYLRTYRNFQTPGQRQHYGRYDKKTPGTQGIPGNRKG